MTARDDFRTQMGAEDGQGGEMRTGMGADTAGDARVSAAVRALPDPRLPDEVLERIWDRTTRAAVAAPGRGSLRPIGALLGVAAVVAISSVGAWLAIRPAAAPAPSEAELARLDREVMMALSIVRDAVSRAEHVAVGQALAGEAAPALEKLSPNEQTRKEGPG